MIEPPPPPLTPEARAARLEAVEALVTRTAAKVDALEALYLDLARHLALPVPPPPPAPPTP